MYIYIETDRKEQPNTFLFTWGYYIGASSSGEKQETWIQEDNDRLRAAIINVGKACRELSETETDVRVITLANDKDGKDWKYGGEHNTLFALLCPPNDFEGRKLRSLYFEYEKFLSKIKELQLRWNIEFRLGEM